MKFLSEAEAAHTAAAEATRVAQEIAAGIQQQAHVAIARIVSRCLSTVFDEPYEFRIKFEQKRGKTEAELVFARDGHEVDPLTASGGGVIDVAAFALRLASMLMSRPAVRRTMIMDEPYRFVSKHYRGRIRGLLESLSAEMGVQFIIVTHFDDLRIGKVVEVEA
jgi:DNA repair exonuclease SbcCD ATPase subunit